MSLLERPVGFVVVEKTLQRQTQVFGRVRKGLVTIVVFKRINLIELVRVVCGKRGFFCWALELSHSSYPAELFSHPELH